jgi:hypothetical protein
LFILLKFAWRVPIFLAAPNRAMLFLFLIAGLILYFLPSIVSVVGAHPSSVEIGFVNLFLGWTIVGWFCCLIWSLFKPRNQVQQMIICAPALVLFRAQQMAAIREFRPRIVLIDSKRGAIDFQPLPNALALLD